MTEKVQKLINYLEENNLVDFYNNQWFDSRNICGDPMENVYFKDKIDVDICDEYGYFEVFGLSNEEFISLKEYFNDKFE